MVEQTLRGRRILIVEDEYFLASDVGEELKACGAEVIGPAGTIEDAAALIARSDRIDAAVLDVNLRGEFVFPVADALQSRGVPFVFATGYDESTLPARFADARRLGKPLQARSIAATLAPMLTAS